MVHVEEFEIRVLVRVSSDAEMDKIEVVGGGCGGGEGTEDGGESSS